MGRMEMSIGPIVAKIDSVLGRLDDMKRAKKKKKERMTQIIASINDNSDSKLYLFVHCRFLWRNGLPFKRLWEQQNIY